MCTCLCMSMFERNKQVVYHINYLFVVHQNKNDYSIICHLKSHFSFYNIFKIKHLSIFESLVFAEIITFSYRDPPWMHQLVSLFSSWRGWLQNSINPLSFFFFWLLFTFPYTSYVIHILCLKQVGFHQLYMFYIINTQKHQPQITTTKVV